jgi:hypothetical protein
MCAKLISPGMKSGVRSACAEGYLPAWEDPCIEMGTLSVWTLFFRIIALWRRLYYWTFTKLAFV